MQRLTSTLFLAAAITAAAAPAAAGIDSHDVTVGLTYGYADAKSMSMQGEFELVPGVELTLAQNTSLMASARVRLDAYDELEPGKPSYDTYTTASKPLALGDAGSLEIRDLYLQFGSDQGLTRVGKQQIVWGRLDGIKVLDLVNPQDFREFIIDDFGDSRISLWSAYFDYSIGKWRAELAVVPDTTGHAIPESGAWYELTAPRFRFGTSPGQGTLPVTTVARAMSLHDTGVGLRLSRQIGAAGFSVVAYSGKDPEPLGRVTTAGGETVLERFYERRDAFGFSFDLGLGSAVVRAEYAYQPKRVFNARPNDQLATIALDQHRGAIGLDFDAPLGIFVNMQYLVDTVADAPPGLVRPASDRIGTLYLRRTFAYDALALEARWYYSLTDEDQLVSLGVAYDLSDSTSVKFSAEHSSGMPEGLFGQFTDRDRLTVNLSHTF